MMLAIIFAALIPLTLAHSLRRHRRDSVLVEVVNESAARAHSKWRGVGVAAVALPTSSSTPARPLAAFYGGETYTTGGSSYTDPSAYVPAATQTGILTASQQAWVDAHNSARAAYGASPVTWSDALVPNAEKNAQLCQHTHTANNDYGENIAWGPGLTEQSTVDMWMSEDKLYNWNKPGYSDPTGHFTQVVWKATAQIGCFIATCKDGSEQTTCEYNPGGNVVNDGYFQANVGAKKT